MTQNFTQQSNSTGLSLARESSLGVLPGNPVWEQREPNSYKDFGQSLSSKARSPINASRQLQKGVVVDRDASGGWQEDLTFPALNSVAEAFMFAAFRTKGDVAVTGVTAAGGYAVAAGGGYFKTGDIVAGVGFLKGANNGPRVLAADGAGNAIAAPGLADEAGTDGYVTKVGRRFAAGDLSVVQNGGLFELHSAAGALKSLGVIPGEHIYIGGDNNDGFAGNVGGFCRVANVSADGAVMVLDKMQYAGADGGNGRSVSVYVGRVVKNESDPDLIRRYSFHMERLLGKDDDTALHQQAEYVEGAVFDKWSMPLNTADKVTMDFSLVGTKYFTNTSAEGPLAGDRPVLSDGDAFTTSNDMVYSPLNVYGDATALYAYLTDISISVDNNVKGNKALGVLGSFDLTAGNFTVKASANAYFANVTAQEAISNNANVTFACGLVKSNKGIVFDMPLVSLGDGKAKVAANEPITLALDLSAARGSLLSPDLDHTLMIVFYDYLPSVAHGPAQ